MKVKLATQVFSHSVKAAMTTAVMTNQLPVEAMETADFMGRLNDIFDCLNSKVLFDSNPLKCALSNKTEQGRLVQEKLRSALTWVQHCHVEKMKKIKGNWVKSLSKPPSFHGFEQTIAAVLQLWECLNAEGVSFLLTNRLTQDALENAFSMCRQKGGFDRNPSAMKFRQNLRHRMQVALMKPPATTNCEEDDEELVCVPSAATSTTSEEDAHLATDTEDEADDVSEVALIDEEPLPTDADDAADSDAEEGASITPSVTATFPSKTTLSLETCSIEYVAGYIAKVVNDKFHCSKCKEELTTDTSVLSEPNQLLILYRSYGTKEGISHLTAPSKVMVAMTDLTLKTFDRHFTSIMHKPHVKSALVDLAIIDINKVNKLWLDNFNICHDHRIFVVQFLVRLKIIKTVLWQSKDLRMPKSRMTHTVSQYSDKLKVVQNV